MNSILRIAHVDTERTWRGGENQVLMLMNGLQKRGHQNFAVVRPKSALAERAQKANFLLKETCPWGEWDFVAAHRLNRWLKAEKVDVVHAHSSHGVALAVFASLGTNIPVIVTRRVDFHLSQNYFSRWKYKRAKKILAISEGVKRVLIASGIPEEKVELVPSGIDFSRHATVKKAWASEMGVPEGSKIIGQVAALAPHKDQATFLRALALLRKKDSTLHAVIVGEGDLRKSLQKLASELGLENAVHLLGFKEDPLRFLAAFDVFCLSSKDEGLGTSLLDAMTLRIPIAATNVGGIPELVQDGQTGFLAPPQSPAALAEKIEQALKVRSNYPDLLTRAFDLARRFDIHTTIQLTEAAYFRQLR